MLVRRLLWLVVLLPHTTVWFRSWRSRYTSDIIIVGLVIAISPWLHNTVVIAREMSCHRQFVASHWRHWHITLRTAIYATSRQRRRRWLPAVNTSRINTNMTLSSLLGLLVSSDGYVALRHGYCYFVDEYRMLPRDCWRHC